MAREKTFEGKIKRELSQRKAWFCKFFANGFTKSGIPDILCCFHGRFLGIEVKGGSKSYGLTALQQYNLEQIATAGGVAMCVYPSGWKKFLEVLDAIADGKWVPDGTWHMYK